MSSENVFDWIRRNKKLIGSEILEVGSKEYRDHSSLKLRETICRRTDLFVGCDIEEGDNVDVVIDLTTDFGTIDAAMGGRRFDTIFCISVLEHIPDVFAAARSIRRLLKEGGHLFVSVPFVFRFHGYPGDYWRFTPEAIDLLFPDVAFERKKPHAVMSTLTQGETYRVSDQFRKRNRCIFRPNDREAKLRRKHQKLAIASDEQADGPEPYMLAPTMINMVGHKVSAESYRSVGDRSAPEAAE